MATLVDLEVEGTGFLKLTSGTTAQRPTSPTVGDIRYNTTFKNAEQYTNRWVQVPPVVTDGATIYLDAAEPTSYTPPGTTWGNLVNSGLNASIAGSIAFTSDGGGGLVFNGSNTTATISYSAANMDFSRAQTICMWLRPGTGASSARRNPYNQAYGGSGTITHETSGGFSYFFGTNGGNNQPYVGFGSNFTVVANETAFICVTRDQSLNIACWYKNGVLVNSSTAGGYTATANGSSPIIIGDGYVEPFIGNIYSVVVYNTCLEPAQIAQAYLVGKGRYGL